MIDKNSVENQFQQQFGHAPELIVKSPGRINIIGEHTDYNEGYVLPAAIDKGIYLAVSKRSDNQIHLYAEGFKELFETDLASIAPSAIGWTNYILGVVNQFLERKLPLQGFNLYLDGDIPAGSGLSSSAAVECATGFGLNELFELGLDRIELAKIGQLAEHTYVGVKCGIMDQFASILSTEDHVVHLDCRDLSYRYVPFHLDNCDIILFNTNVKHSLASSAYNDRRAACEQAVAWVKEQYPATKSLRDVSIDMLDAIVRERSQDIYTKSKYVIEENERVLKACEALEANDATQLGKLLFAAHWALSKEYEVSCPELDFLVDAAGKDTQVYGARMMGGGFGGCTINLIKQGYAEQLIADLAPKYKERFDLELTPIQIKISGGTQVI